MLTVTEPTKQLGTIQYNVPVTIIYDIINDSDQPIEITKTGSSCGCTTPSISINPVPAYGRSSLVCVYSANNKGKNHKSASLTTKTQHIDVSFSATVK